jgi:hypothetical protein
MAGNAIGTPAGIFVGRRFACIVEAPENEGYRVKIVELELPGFLLTKNHHRQDAFVMSEFACVHHGRIILKELDRPKSGR